ncbi:uncharacterized protein LOC106656547 isoform X3 [Trichogramma pretiosum]|uniref:uncharacterized protein LOC106656547 isoform X3 n=1 Tax=Trichogramma pretiosum TaxID=7493 RepID=UPI0006C96180|nr:uncharacterized protein LOC106656547 isoform X3 [Trichogramma pretiosum]
MIGSFWNLCRACPSMPIDKLHSEYRSTYTWHEYTGSGQQDHNSQQQAVVRRAPQQQQHHQQQNPKEQEAKLVAAAPVIKPSEDDVAGTGEGPSMEPPLPRRKKYPELAYRTHEFIPAAAADAAGVDCLDSNVVADKVREVAKVLPTSQLSKAITKISTEYRLQFAWPRKQQQALTNGEVNEAGQHPPRKSLSMGVLRQGSLFGGGGGGPGGAAPIAPVHKKRGQQEINKQQQITGQPAVLAQQQSHQISSSELEPLVGRKQQPPQHLLSNVVEERDEPDQAPTAPAAVNYRKRTTGAGRAVRLVDPDGSQQQQQQQRPFSAAQVVELRRELKRLAEEYKHRDWTGSGEDENAGLWRHVSSSQALEALSLARHQQSPSSKEQKEKENTRKVAVPAAGRPSNEQARPVFQPEDFGPDNDRALARARRDFLFRHHLDRTTGVTLGDGALLPSPTREKLEPVTPRRRDETPVGQGGQEPPQSARSRPSPKSSPRAARSQSAGPAALKEGRSPKRRPVSCSQANKVDGEKTTERQPRPKTAGRTKIVRIDDGSSTTRRPRRSSSSVATTTRSASRTRSTAVPVARVMVTRPSIRCNNKKLTAEPAINGQDQPQQPAEQPPWMENGQPLVKSPPEPTRVKSPEQMIMRSPEPVNWTVPLDTGKTFTVTQNVLEGEPLTRAHSEARSWGPQSAPPELTGRLQHRLHQQGSGYKSPDSESMSLPSFGAASNGLHKDDSAAGSPMASKDEPIQEQPQQHASDLLEKARNRFDKFWGKSSPDDQQQQQQQPPQQ